jgi:chromosome segregation ATPase
MAQFKPKDKEHAHYLYVAERRVDIAKAMAQFQDAQAKGAQLDREHDAILLEASRLDTEMARRQLEQQRQQNQMIQEEAARLQQQGVEYSQALEQAKAEGDKARQVAAAQAKVANAAKKQAALAEAAARAMRDMNSSDGGAPANTPATGSSKKKSSGGN